MRRTAASAGRCRRRETSTVTASPTSSSAPRFFNGNGTDRGRAQIFLGGADSYHRISAYSASTSGQAGSDIGRLCGLRGRERRRVLRPALRRPLYDAGQTDEGRAYCFLGGPAGISTLPRTGRGRRTSRAHFGAVIANAGDVNGDGYDDVVVTRRRDSTGLRRRARVRLSTGRARGLSPVPAWTFSPGQTGRPVRFLGGLGRRRQRRRLRRRDHRHAGARQPAVERRRGLAFPGIADGARAAAGCRDGKGTRTARVREPRSPAPAT